ncbi:MAG: penicillin-binding transpeptidase domain-containing protein [Anaerobacillus sp.]|uniref:penicillin-binding transpeptidase domain-containing protein n=1 Tax=Anaerobacillus sp. TaxID=1872506 RepID=UPI00391BDA1C
MLQQSSKVLLVIVSLLVFTLIGCSKEEEVKPTPEEAFEAYAAFWEDGNYGMMYEYLSSEAKQKMTKEEFIERNTTIYQEIDATNLSIKMIVEEIAEEEQQELPEENEPETEKLIEFEKSMETIAGDIYFRETVLLKLEAEEPGEDSQETWRLDWKQAMILPPLQEGDEVKVRTLLPTKRGEIVDRNGEALAVNGKILEFGIVPERLPEDEAKSIEDASRLLEMSVAEIENKLNQSWVKPGHFVPLKSISQGKQDLFNELMRIPGVTYREVDSRVYPLGEMAAHLIGYIGKITDKELESRKDLGYHANSYLGKAGLEAILEDQLRGEIGRVIYLENEAGEETVTIAKKEPVDGPVIELTIDTKLQKSIFSQLQGETGTSVALHPITGEVLSLVSSPAYDPNDFVLGISSQKWQELNEDEAKPFLNRFTQTFTPGSTIKPITAAIAIDNGLDKTEKRVINGLSWGKDTTWGGYRVSRVTDPNHDVDLRDALVYSDNIYFAQIAIELGKDKLESGLKNFGFEERIPFEYGMAVSKVANETINSEIQLADTGYGQGELQISPLHLALLYTAFVNEGSIPTPTLFTNRTEVLWKENLVDAENASYILSALLDVIEDPQGTATKAKITGLPLAGKTGTTEHKMSQNDAGKETGWFVAMNTDAPKLLVLMMIDDVQDRGGSGMVVPKVKKVFSETFPR